MKPAEYPTETIATIESQATLPSCENAAVGVHHGLNDCCARRPTGRIEALNPGSQICKMSFLSLGP